MVDRVLACEQGVLGVGFMVPLEALWAMLT